MAFLALTLGGCGGTGSGDNHTITPPSAQKPLYIVVNDMLGGITTAYTDPINTDEAHTVLEFKYPDYAKSALDSGNPFIWIGKGGTFDSKTASSSLKTGAFPDGTLTSPVGQYLETLIIDGSGNLIATIDQAISSGKSYLAFTAAGKPMMTSQISLNDSNPGSQLRILLPSAIGTADYDTTAAVAKLTVSALRGADLLTN